MSENRQPATLSYGDPLRILAMAAVILIHVLPHPKEVARPDLGWFCVANTWTRWCVPAFFMLSGALLLDPARRESPGAFYRRRAWRLGFPVLVWSALYFCFRIFVQGETVGVRDAIRDLARGEPMYHLWFAFTLVGLYLVTPLIRAVFLPLPVRTRWALALTCLGVTTVSAGCSALLGYRRVSQVTDEWVSYLGYFLLGQLIRDVRVSGSKLALLVGLGVALASLAAVGEYYSELSSQPERWRGLFAGYLAPIPMLESICVFLVLASLLVGEWTRARAVSLLGAASFGAYLAHVAVLDTLSIIGWPTQTAQPLARVLLLWVVAAVVSFGVALLLERIPYLNWVVGAGKPSQPKSVTEPPPDTREGAGNNKVAPVLGFRAESEAN